MLFAVVFALLHYKCIKIEGITTASFAPDESRIGTMTMIMAKDMAVWTVHLDAKNMNIVHLSHTT